MSMGRLTYTDIQNQFLRNTGNQGSTNTTLLADFNLNLGQRYQFVFGVLNSYVNTGTQTASTVASQQFYHNPPGLVHGDDVTVTLSNSFQYPLQPIYDQHQWDLFNAIPIQPTAIPQFIFYRRDDFGIWPIPQDVYSITFNGFFRDRNMLVADYLTGTATVTNGSTTLTGAGTTWTAGMVGRWFTVTDTTMAGQGVFSRVKTFVSTTSLTLETAYEGSSGTTASAGYRIGESPEMPEEGHIILVDGVTADYFAGLRSDITKATWFNNKFATGDGNNNSRKVGDKSIFGGLIGIMNRYANRDTKRLIIRQPQPFLPQYSAWGSTISGS